MLKNSDMMMTKTVISMVMIMIIRMMLVTMIMMMVVMAMARKMSWGDSAPLHPRWSHLQDLSSTPPQSPLPIPCCGEIEN
tara:strand:- start:79 stop:318 length:240 start_codon:yes stop_codon:yes gene_type:complete